MGAVADFVEDVAGGAVEIVGDVAEAVVDTAGSIVEQAGEFVTDTVDAALADPIGTVAKVAAVATGNAYLLPYISAGSVIANGGSIEDAIVAGGTTYVAQGVADYVGEQISAPGVSNPVYDYAEPIPNPVYDYGSVYDTGVEVGAAIPESSIEVNPLPPLEPEAPVVPRDVVAPPVDGPVQDMGTIEITAPRPEMPVDMPTQIPAVLPDLGDNIDAGGGQNFADVPVSDAVPSIVNPDVPVVPVDTGVVDFLDYVPIILPTGPVMPTAPTRPPLTPLDPTVFGSTESLVDPGLNPGMITDVPQDYATTSPVQSKFYYGQRPYQEGRTFDQDLYRQVPAAPAQPFGLQELYDPTDINAYLRKLAMGPIAPKTGV
jgi:hypothetical protein